MANHIPHWTTYDAEIDEAPAQITCDVSLLDREARPANAITLFVMGADLQDPTSTGLGSTSEWHAIEQATARIHQALEAPTQPLGTVITRGTWQLFLQTSPNLPEELIPRTRAILSDKGWTQWIHAEPDPTWSRYEQFLLPPAEERILTMNDRAIQSLERAGHDLAIPRTITHKLAFPSREAADLAQSTLTLLDFHPAAPPKTDKDHYTQMRVQRQDAPANLPSLTLMLSEVCAPFDGDHLSWTATE